MACRLLPRVPLLADGRLVPTDLPWRGSPGIVSGIMLQSRAKDVHPGVRSSLGGLPPERLKREGMQAMLSWLLPKVIPSKNERELRRIRPLAERITQLEPEVVHLSDAELGAKTAEFRERLEHGETIEELLPEAFAVGREAAKRVLHMRHFDVQLIGGIVLHEGKIAEMATGEGKTLVATLPAYLNALTGRGVHVVTVNDYLARRDTEWMGPLYRMLGLTVGTIQHDMDDAARKKSY